MDRTAVAICTCIAVLFVVDRLYWNGAYFAAFTDMLSNLKQYVDP
jgi:hypothetical protein